MVLAQPDPEVLEYMRKVSVVSSRDAMHQLSILLP